MEAACDFCGEGRATVYCRADSARLCLPCDRQVHNANALAQRHLRTLLCHACNIRPAAVRCPSCHTSLCQSCDCETHNSTLAAAQHKRHNFDCFTGCPSATELATLWACDFNEPRNLSGAVLASPPARAYSNQWGVSNGAAGAIKMGTGPIGRESWTSDAQQRMDGCPGVINTMPGVGSPLLAKVEISSLSVWAVSGYWDYSCGIIEIK